MHRSAWGRTLIAILLGGALAAAIPVLPAVGQDSPPHPVVDVGTGRLVAKGAAVDVPLEITCNASRVEVFVTVTQRVSKGVAAGSGFASFGCTGSGQDVTVRVRASAAGKAFIRGNAVIEAEAFGCNRRLCGSETDSETVQLRR